MKKTVALIVSLVAAAAINTHAADAKANWEQHCAKCHGVDGAGKTKMGEKLKAKDYTDAKVQESLKDDDMLKAIKEGVKDKDTGKTLMKGFGDVMTDDENKAFVAYIRAFKK